MERYRVSEYDISQMTGFEHKPIGSYARLEDAENRATAFSRHWHCMVVIDDTDPAVVTGHLGNKLVAQYRNGTRIPLPDD